MRVGGLASGMDIDSIVKDMMKAKRIPLDKLKQKKQVLEWQRDDYRSMNTLMLGFRDKLASLKLTSSYRSRIVSSTNDAQVSATVASGASQASYTISQVKQLATAATRVGAEIAGIDPVKSFKDQNSNIGWSQGVLESKTFTANGKVLDVADLKIAADTSINVKVNGKSYKVITDPSKEPSKDEVLFTDGKLTFREELGDKSSVKVDYIVAEKQVDTTINKDQNLISLGKSSVNIKTIKINNEEYELDFENKNPSGYPALKLKGTTPPQNGSVTGWVDIKSGNILFESGIKENDKVTTTYTQNYTDFSIGVKTSTGEASERIFVTDAESLNNVIRKVNDSSAGVTMFFDEHTKQLTMTRKETGNSEIMLEGDFINNVLKMENKDAEGKYVGTEGKNAIFTVNGLETQRTSNTFSMNGVTFTLKQTFTDPVTVGVSNDSEGVLTNIKEFVDQYNKLIEDMNKKLNEERYRSYQPLTDDQREGLSDKQQEKWEEMAKSGLLKGDPILSGVLSSMRLDMSSSVETNGLFSQLSQIGITTTANYLDGGKLEINEAKLKEAIDQDPEAVENLFRGTGTTDANRGVVHKLYDSVNQSMTKIQDRAGRATSTKQQFALGREMLDVDKRITSSESRLKQYEDRLWRQFTAMEKAIQRANSQSAYLMQQFGGF